MDLTLLRAYLRTGYRVKFPGGEIEIRIGQAVSVMPLETAGVEPASWVIITAWNPGSRPQTEEQNRAAHARLVAEIEGRGWSWFPGDGVPLSENWPIERGCFVAGISRSAALDLCRQFDQNAVVFGTRGKTPALLLSDGREIRSVDEWHTPG